MGNCRLESLLYSTRFLLSMVICSLFLTIYFVIYNSIDISILKSSNKGNRMQNLETIFHFILL